MQHTEIEGVLALLKARPWPPAIADRRKVYDTMGDRFPPDPDVVHASETMNGVAVEWTTAPGADVRGTVVYLHGGGYVYGSLKSHRHLAAQIGRACGLRSLAVDYRLAPEHPFPAALDDLLAVLRRLHESGADFGRIALAGDSAGGGLAVAAMVALRDAGLPLPSCALLFSPFTDMQASGRSFIENADVDCSIKKETVEFVARAYLNGADPRHPLASPIHADLRGLPPLMIMAGSTEILLDDSTALARAAGMAGVRTRLEIWPGMVHIWPTYHRILSQGRQAIEAGAAFIRASLRSEPAHRVP